MDISTLLAQLQPLIQTLHPAAYSELLKGVLPPDVRNQIVDNAMMVSAQPKGKGAMKKPLFTIFEVNNGFIAELNLDMEDIVVSDTLSGVCSAAQAACAAHAAAGDTSTPEQLLTKVKSKWQKLP
jgi:hypothetical protein